MIRYVEGTAGRSTLTKKAELVRSFFLTGKGNFYILLSTYLSRTRSVVSQPRAGQPLAETPVFLGETSCTTHTF
jgi:hypothetical protein